MKEYIVHAPNDNKTAVEEYTSFYGEPITELIRCKDCKWYEMGEEETYCRELGIFNTDPTSYCSYARRKEE